jgi:hypothetical protein
MTKAKTKIVTNPSGKTVAVRTDGVKGQKAVGLKIAALDKMDAKMKATPVVLKQPVPRVRKTVAKSAPADIGRLVTAFQNAQPCAPKVNEEATAKEAPPTALSTNMRQVDTQLTELHNALCVLEQKLHPVLAEERDNDGGEPSSVEYEGNSSVNAYLRSTAGKTENLTSRIKALISRLEI